MLSLCFSAYSFAILCVAVCAVCMCVCSLYLSISLSISPVFSSAHAHALSHPHLRGRYFRKYGQLANIKLKFDGSREHDDCAVVEFEDLVSAEAAVKDPNAVLGNRFIR